MEQDTRIPVVFGQQPEPDDMVLLEEGLDAPAVGHVWRFVSALPGHMPGCACCVARSPAAAALAAAFRARATGQAPYFKRLLVLAKAGGRLDIETALAQDILCRARFVLS
jgi:predicted protein tyrosine phosphatase